MIDRIARLVAPAAVALFAIVGVALSEATAPVFAAAAGLLVLVAGVAVGRVSGWPLILALSVAVALLAVICNEQPSNVGWFGMCALSGWAAFVEPVRRAAAVGGLSLVAFVGQWLAITDEPGWVAWIAGTVFTAVSCALARRQQMLLEQLREAQAGLAQRAAAEERNRIAHELHDVIGHALTVSLLHITSARLALAEDPAEAGEALEQAERLSQQSLADVRAVVGLMKDPSAPAPLPGVEEIDTLVESFRGAGTSIEYDVTGDLSQLTATEGLTVYRILQEALTNVARHAPGSPATVYVVVGDGQTRVQVDSVGRPGRPSDDGAGLTGMRERAEALGGRLTAGPSGNGWRVEAVLPA
ncbi:MAG TPA: sensor histidine kinase [Nocardioides sp.]|nr:sensor histidine kinase [Nocardioides sp.]